MLWFGSDEHSLIVRYLTGNMARPRSCAHGLHGEETPLPATITDPSSPEIDQPAVVTRSVSHETGCVPMSADLQLGSMCSVHTMRWMKRSSTLVVVIAVLLAACGTGDDSEESEAAEDIIVEGESTTPTLATDATNSGSM